MHAYAITYIGMHTRVAFVQGNKEAEVPSATKVRPKKHGENGATPSFADHECDMRNAPQVASCNATKGALNCSIADLHSHHWHATSVALATMMHGRTTRCANEGGQLCENLRTSNHMATLTLPMIPRKGKCERCGGNHHQAKTQCGTPTIPRHEVRRGRAFQVVMM